MLGGAPAPSKARSRAQRLDAVERLHLPVDQQHVIGPAGGDLGLGPARPRPRRSRRASTRRPSIFSRSSKCDQRFGQVVDQQRAQALQRDRRGQFAGFARALEPGREPEGAARARRAVHAGVAAHQLREVARQRQPEPGAAMAARSRVVGLLEGVNSAAWRSGAMPTPVSCTSKRTCRRWRSSASRSPRSRTQPLIGELDGVGQQIDQGLRQPRRIAAQPARQVVGVEHQLQALSCARSLTMLEGARQQLVERELDVVELSCRPRSSRDRGCR